MDATIGRVNRWNLRVVVSVCCYYGSDADGDFGGGGCGKLSVYCYLPHLTVNRLYNAWLFFATNH